MRFLKIHQSSLRPQGFTLAEVLIALALLGIVASFAIPKVLQSAGDGKKIALFRETLASLSAVTYQGILDGELNATTFFDYFANHLNTLKTCPNDAQQQGCWPGGSDATLNLPTLPGLVLANGVYIMDFEENSSMEYKGDSIYIDYNGVSGPNQIGMDQLKVTLCWSEFIDNYPDAMEPGHVFKAGTVSRGRVSSNDPNPALNSLNTALWNQIVAQ